jgi:hypothetical protein
MRQPAPFICFIAAAGLAVLSPWPVLAADTVPTHLDAARQAYQKGDAARTAMEAEAALTELHDRLGKGLAEFMPGALAGWQAEAPEVQGLGLVGGGLAVTRAFSKTEQSLNATLILDSPAVNAAVALQAGTTVQPSLKRVKLGADDALLRWDANTKAGEITIVLGNRVLLQIEGDNLPSSDVLVESAKGWNVAGIRKFIGI